MCARDVKTWTRGGLYVRPKQTIRSEQRPTTFELTQREQSVVVSDSEAVGSSSRLGEPV